MVSVLLVDEGGSVLVMGLVYQKMKGQSMPAPDKVVSHSLRQVNCDMKCLRKIYLQP